MRKANSLEKTLMLGKIEGKRRRGLQGWGYHRLSGHGYEKTPGDSEGQGSLAGCSPWGCKESDMTQRLNSKTFVWFLSEDGASLVAQMVKHLPAMRETRVRSLGWEDPLEKEMAIHSSILPRKFHGWRNLVGYSPWGCKESDTTDQLHSLLND